MRSERNPSMHCSVQDDLHYMIAEYMSCIFNVLYSETDHLKLRLA